MYKLQHYCTRNGNARRWSSWFWITWHVAVLCVNSYYYCFGYLAQSSHSILYCVHCISQLSNFCGMMSAFLIRVGTSQYHIFVNTNTRNNQCCVCTLWPIFFTNWNRNCYHRMSYFNAKRHQNRFCPRPCWGTYSTPQTRGGFKWSYF